MIRMLILTIASSLSFPFVLIGMEESQQETTQHITKDGSRIIRRPECTITIFPILLIEPSEHTSSPDCANQKDKQPEFLAESHSNISKTPKKPDGDITNSN